MRQGHRRREQRLHDMTSAEEHIAMRWLCDHLPAAFDQVADVIERMRAADERAVRTPQHPTLPLLGKDRR